MTIYLVILEDRHVDVEVRPFRKIEDALKDARAIRDEYFAEIRACGHEPPEQHHVEGWLFNANLSEEGDAVRVEKAELR